MSLELIYIGIGLCLAVLSAVLSLIAIGRYAFHCALREYPDPTECFVIPGVPVMGSRGDEWLEVAFFTFITYVVVGSVVITIGWPLLFVILVHLIISSSRKKRFGKHRH